MSNPYLLGSNVSVTVEPPVTAVPLFAANETPSGAITGTTGSDGNAVFTLNFAPSPAGSLQLTKTDVGTGVLLIAGIHFNLVGLTITYTAGNIPMVGQEHRAWYQH